MFVTTFIAASITRFQGYQNTVSKNNARINLQMKVATQGSNTMMPQIKQQEHTSEDGIVSPHERYVRWGNLMALKSMHEWNIM